MSVKNFIRNALIAASGVAVALVATSAMAKDFCTSAPTAQWKPVHEVTSHATQLGYSVTEVEREGSCYEIKGYDRHGAKMKILYNPQTGEPMRYK